MRQLIVAAFAASLLGLGGAAAALPAEAACWHVPGGWRCVHHPAARHRVIVHKTIVHPAPASPPVVVHKTIVRHQG